MESDRLALIDALKNNKIDIIATDHAPHTWDEKNQDYPLAPAGLPLVQHGLQILMDFYHQDVLSLEMIVEKTSHNVAKRFQIKERGYIREGYYADLVLFDLNSPWKVSDSILYSKCNWTPLKKEAFKSKVIHTIVSGNHVFDNGIINKNPNSKRIEFKRD